MNEYDKGTLVKCRATFTDPDTGAAVDPTTVTVTVTNPAGVATNYTYGGGTLLKDSVGHYRINVDGNAAGTWHFVFASTGTYQGAGDASFSILEL